MSITFKHTGNFSKTLQFLNVLMKKDYLNRLNNYGLEGVKALAAATPKDTGNTAAAWDYIIEDQNGRVSISWVNRNVNEGVNIAVVLNYGHGTGFGTYVQGRQYISPTIQPIFDEIADNIWKEVTSA